jgi:hypothetical protein
MASAAPQNSNKLLDWNGRAIPVSHSKGGVKAVSYPYANLIRTGFTAWPPPEIVQRLYKSRQFRTVEGKQRIFTNHP